MKHIRMKGTTKNKTMQALLYFTSMVSVWFSYSSKAELSWKYQVIWMKEAVKDTSQTSTVEKTARLVLTSAECLKGWTMAMYRSKATRRTWQIEAIALNRINITDETQMLMKVMQEQIARRGNPTTPEIRSDKANEVRNIFVIDCRVFFLEIKKITRPLETQINEEIMASKTI